MNNPYESQDILRAPDEKPWYQSVADFLTPNTSKWFQDGYAGRPQSAPGILYDILPEVADWGVGLGKKAASIPIQMYRRAQVAKQIPEMGALFKELGNPLSNIGRMISDTASDLSNRIPQMGNRPVEMMADIGTNTYNPQRLIDKVKGAWGIDVPYLTDGRLPQALVTTDADNQLLGKIAEALGARPGQVPQGAKGFFTSIKDNNRYLSDIAAMRRDAIPAGTGLHEVGGHGVSKRVRGYGDTPGQPSEHIDEARRAIYPDAPDIAPDIMADYFSAVTQNNPKYAKALAGKSTNYGKLPPDKLGEEIISRQNAGQLGNWNAKVPFDDPEPFFRQRYQDYGLSLTHPSIRPEQLGETLPLSMPMLRSIMNSLSQE